METIETKEVLSCCNCRTVFEENENHHSFNNELWCEDCFNDSFSWCEKCDSVIENDDIVNAGDEYLCQSCFDDKYFHCAHCSTITKNDDQYTAPNDESYCSECFFDTCSTCEECSETMWSDDSCYDDDSGNTYCSSCYEDLEPKPDFKHSKTFDKNPHKRHVGLELEYIQTDEVYFDGLGIIKEDGSVNPLDHEHGEGLEFNSHPSNGDLLFQNIDAICKEFNEKKAFVNRTCGFHVHLDMRDSTREEQENIYSAWRVFEPIFFDMTSPSRKTSNYCKATAEHDFSMARNCGDRFRSLNVQSMTKYKTFEIRLHQGTLDAKKIKAWVTLLLNFFDVFGKMDMKNLFTEMNNKSQREKLILLFQHVKYPIALKKYILERLKKFEAIRKYTKAKTAKTITKSLAA